MQRVGINRPVGVQRLHGLEHTLRVSIYTNSVGVFSVCLFTRVSYDLKKKMDRGKMPRFLYVATRTFDYEPSNIRA